MPIGLSDVEYPALSRQLAHRGELGCQPYAPAMLYPQTELLELISLRDWVNTRTMVQLEKLEKFSDLIKTLTCNLPACSIVLQPSMLQATAKISTSYSVCLN
jgi:hypothetical protein